MIYFNIKLYSAILVFLCFFLVSCSTTKVSEFETPDESVLDEINIDWNDEMEDYVVIVVFDIDYYYVFDLYYIPEYDKEIPSDYISTDDIMSIEIFRATTNDIRITNLGIDNRRNVIFIELENIAEELKNSSYMKKFMKSDIIE